MFSESSALQTTIRCTSLRSAHTHTSWLHNGNTTGKLIEIRILYELKDELVHGKWPHAAWPKQHDSRVATGRMLMYISELDVEGKQYPRILLCGITDLHVGFS